jgi:hypothetical protein
MTNFQAVVGIDHTIEIEEIDDIRTLQRCVPEFFFATPIQISKLWRAFSNEQYSAGWLKIERTSGSFERFKEWLTWEKI